MARTKSTQILEAIIIEAEKKVPEAKEEYDYRVSELKSLLAERKKLQIKELMI